MSDDTSELNEITYQVYRDRIDRGFTHDEAMAGARAYDRILREETAGF
jgi:hypothetical protein